MSKLAKFMQGKISDEELDAVIQKHLKIDVENSTRTQQAIGVELSVTLRRLCKEHPTQVNYMCAALLWTMQGAFEQLND